MAPRDITETKVIKVVQALSVPAAMEARKAPPATREMLALPVPLVSVVPLAMLVCVVLQA